MQERPILFSAPMVRALLEGRKTQTRRVVKLREFGPSTTRGYDWTFRDRRALWNDVHHAWLLERCPYGVPGDRLWVRETFQPLWADHDKAPPDGMKSPKGWALNYVATGGVKEWFDEAGNGGLTQRCSPAIHMPRWASRITLEVTEVRVQRLHDISGADAYAEGCSEHGPEKQGLAVHEFARLWRAINGSPSWESNPWVWAISFRVLPPPSSPESPEERGGG